MSITILKPGIMSSIQDLGRWGFQQYGVPVGGAMDKVSASLANIICGNDEKEPLVEMTLHGSSVLFHEHTCCAITGGGCRAFVEDVELPFNHLLFLPALSILHTKAAVSGCRTYLAVAGGFDIQQEMGSCSTYVPSGIGGLQGRNLIAGDTIRCKEIKNQIHSSALKTLSGKIRISNWHVPGLSMEHEDPEIICIVRGPEKDLFEEHAYAKLLQSSFSISSQSNRMGYRLEGEKIISKDKVEMVSTPVAAGVMQITHEGSPIVLMADAQTTGGYPRIARVCGADIPFLAQKRPGEKIKFTEIDEEESRLRLSQMQLALMKLKNGIRV